MNTQDKIIELREATGMNRKVFCEYFKIPYRTVTDWELVTGIVRSMCSDFLNTIFR